MSTTFHPLVIQKIDRETADTVSLSFDIPDSLKNEYAYTQGQYLTLQFTFKGKEERRAYSMSSSPFEAETTVTVKKVSGGLVSTHINDVLKVGDTVSVMPPQGRFFTTIAPHQRKTYYLFGAGSGITPLMSILKTVLEQEPQSVVYLLYGNRSAESIVFNEQLDSLQKRYEGQLVVTHILSQPKKEKQGGLGGFFKKAVSSWSGKIGRITAAEVKVFLQENPCRTKEAEYFICGPSAMMQAVETTLQGQSIDKKQIHVEHFDSHPAAPDSEKVALSVGEAQLIATLDGEIIKTTIPKGKTILDALVALKADAPYSCTSGACSTCMAKCVSGTVVMDRSFGLDEDEVAKGYILTCQARPTSASVEISYDM